MFVSAQPASCLHGGAAWWSHEFCWSGTGELLCSWRGASSPACRSSSMSESSPLMNWLTFFELRLWYHDRNYFKLFQSVTNLLLNSGVVRFRQFFHAPGPSGFWLRISGRRHLTSSPGWSPTHLSFSSWPPLLQQDLWWPGWPTRRPFAFYLLSSRRSVVLIISLVAPERSFSSIDSMFFGRVSSAF